MEEWMEETKNGNMLEISLWCAFIFLCRDHRPGKTSGVPPRGLEAAAASSLGDAAIPHGSPQEVWTRFHIMNCKLLEIHVFSLMRISFCLTPSMSQGDPERKGEPDVQREPGHCFRSDTDEGSRAGRHDSAERHPIPETCGGKPHHQWRRALLRGEKRTLDGGSDLEGCSQALSSCDSRLLNKINEVETCKNQEPGLARVDKQKKNTTCF